VEEPSELLESMQLHMIDDDMGCRPHRLRLPKFLDRHSWIESDIYSDRDDGLNLLWSCLSPMPPNVISVFILTMNSVIFIGGCCNNRIAFL
jgi:hypothetical protein